MADIKPGVTNLLASVNRLVSSPDITNALAALRPTLDQYRELGAKLTSRVDPLADSITNYARGGQSRAGPDCAAPAKTCGPCSRPIRRCATISTRPCNNSPAPSESIVRAR